MKQAPSLTVGLRLLRLRYLWIGVSSTKARVEMHGSPSKQIPSLTAGLRLLRLWHLWKGASSIRAIQAGKGRGPALTFRHPLAPACLLPQT